jgi:hypothetical protein
MNRRPPFVTVNVEVADFEVLGTRGLLELQFLNDRLSSVVYSPPSPEQVFGELSRIPGAIHISDSELQLAPATEIRLVTLEGHTKLIVRDTCLARETEDWIKRYAALGLPCEGPRGRPTRS